MPSTVAPLCLMIDALTEVWIEVMSLEASAMDARSNMVTMLSTGGVIGPLAGMLGGVLAGGMAICELADEMADVRVVVFTEVFMNLNVDLVAVIILAGVAPSVYAKDVGNNSCVGIVSRTDVLTVVRVDARVDVFVDPLARAANDGFPADIDANISVTVLVVLEIIVLPTGFEESLLCPMAFRCWSITVLGSRELQAWMPSCQLC